MRIAVMLAPLLLLLLPLAGCQAEDRGLSWIVEFDDPALEGRARVFDAAIIDGECVMNERAIYRYRTTFDAAGAPPRPLALPPGDYGFSVRVRDANCMVFAEGCTVEQLPRVDGAMVLTRLVARAEETACSSDECDLGNCTGDDTIDPQMAADGAVDGAVVDGAVDDTSVDTGPPPTFSWATSEWSPCSANCGVGTETRTVSCVGEAGSAADPSACTDPMPEATRACDAGSSTCGWGSWGSYGSCSAVCAGTQSRTRNCNDAGHCDGSNSESRSCDTGACCDTIGSCTPFVWQTRCNTSTGRRCETRQCITDGNCTEARDVGACLVEC